MLQKNDIKNTDSNAENEHYTPISMESDPAKLEDHFSARISEEEVTQKLNTPSLAEKASQDANKLLQELPSEGFYNVENDKNICESFTRNTLPYYIECLKDSKVGYTHIYQKVCSEAFNLYDGYSNAIINILNKAENIRLKYIGILHGSKERANVDEILKINEKSKKKKEILNRSKNKEEILEKYFGKDHGNKKGWHNFLMGIIAIIAIELLVHMVFLYDPLEGQSHKDLIPFFSDVEERQKAFVEYVWQSFSLALFLVFLGFWLGRSFYSLGVFSNLFKFKGLSTEVDIKFSFLAALRGILFLILTAFVIISLSQLRVPVDKDYEDEVGQACLVTGTDKTTFFYKVRIDTVCTILRKLGLEKFITSVVEGSGSVSNSDDEVEKTKARDQTNIINVVMWPFNVLCFFFALFNGWNSYKSKASDKLQDQINGLDTKIENIDEEVEEIFKAMTEKQNVIGTCINDLSTHELKLDDVYENKNINNKTNGLFDFIFRKIDSQYLSKIEEYNNLFIKKLLSIYQEYWNKNKLNNLLYKVDIDKNIDKIKSSFKNNIDSYKPPILGHTCHKIDERVNRKNYDKTKIIEELETILVYIQSEIKEIKMRYSMVK